MKVTFDTSLMFEGMAMLQITAITPEQQKKLDVIRADMQAAGIRYTASINKKGTNYVRLNISYPVASEIRQRSKSPHQNRRVRSAAGMAAAIAVGKHGGS